MPVLLGGRTLTAPVIVTGATGFVGRTLLARIGAGARALHMGREDWAAAAEALPWRGATVFHLAARAHQPGATEAAYMRDNAAKTRDLARIASAHGVRRVVFLSSIKVNGEESRDRPFVASDVPAPEDAYGRSKLAAEEALHESARAGALEICVVRSPLVYGRGAGGNLRSLLRLADTPWPLPFGGLRNRRSFIHVGDLADALLACADRGVAGRTYLVAYREPCSTADLVAQVRARLGRPARLFAVPAAVLEAAAAVSGQRERMRRLTRSLEIDASAAERELAWRARRQLREAVGDLVAGYREA